KPTMNAATGDALKAYNHQYYTPENMTLVVVGPIDPAKVRAMVDRIFGAIPATGYKPAPAPAPKPPPGVVRRVLERPDEEVMLARGRGEPRSDDPNGDAVDLLTTILAGSESSRLARRLRDEERLVNSVTMNYSAQMGGGIISLRAELEAKDMERVQQIVLEEIAKMQESGPTDEERQLAVTKFEAQHAFDTETSEGLANAYALAETTWTLAAELGYVDRLRRITNDQIRGAAGRYLSRRNEGVVGVVRKKSGPRAGAPSLSGGWSSPRWPPRARQGRSPRRSPAPASPTA